MCLCCYHCSTKKDNELQSMPVKTELDPFHRFLKEAPHYCPKQDHPNAYLQSIAMAKFIDYKAEGTSHRNKMVPLPISFLPPHSEVAHSLIPTLKGTWCQIHVQPPDVHKPERTGPSALRSRFPSQLSSRPAPSLQQKPEPLSGKQLRVAAVPPSLSSPSSN